MGSREEEIPATLRKLHDQLGNPNPARTGMFAGLAGHYLLENAGEFASLFGLLAVMSATRDYTAKLVSDATKKSGYPVDKV